MLGTYKALKPISTGVHTVEIQPERVIALLLGAPVKQSDCHRRSKQRGLQEMSLKAGEFNTAGCQAACPRDLSKH